MSSFATGFRRLRGCTALAIAFCLSLVACASRPTEALLPVPATVPGASLVDMLVATTRAKSPDPGILFSGQRGAGLSLDNIVVSIPPDQNRTIGDVVWPKRYPGDPAHEFVTLHVIPLTVDGAEQWFNRAASGKRRVLIFVHGFNNRYEDAVYRFAQIVHDSGADVIPVLFTWPSGGSVFDYNYDRESANYSRTALETILREAATSPQVDSVTVMAHSMGGWLTMEALRQLAIRDGHLPAKLQNVILASPDLDVDVFGKQLQEIDTHRTRITLFTSTDDRALGLSRRIAGGVDRLGAINPAQEPYRSGLEAKGITVLDLSALKAGDSVNHTKFAESPEVVRLIGDRLIAGQKITDADISVGERIEAATLGAAQAVGSAAGAVATLPIAVIDPDARRTLHDRVRNVGQSLGGTLQTAIGQ
ncbi:alpha/beta hydrolase [Consotaella salsifontis]|uniref:Esterase/lipase superfamily enzyme n=1 Tax=Consotaella salsifontis TaxID=1365950 RepID=A0A1T4RKG7_9HYPH|nr:alpha/beta hydrolase [Consotaella salsifontis]SKA16397.1 Esterase/lipase superfamily enzyme [Consotaella salsifontis]